jgi:hypothetical protein
MSTICKVSFMMSLVVVVLAGTCLLRADLHERTGHLVGMGWKCGTCEPGGSSCNGPNTSTCCNTPACESGTCSSSCPGTAGETCAENENAGAQCDDGAKSCADSTRPKCEQYTDMFGYTMYRCSSSETETADCGDSYNVCNTK